MLSKEKIIKSQTLENKIVTLEIIEELKQKNFIGSGIVLTLSTLGGDEVLTVCINDDLISLLDCLEIKIKEDIEKSVNFAKIKRFLEKMEEGK